MACNSSNTSASYPFSEGELVEVSSKADGFRGVWYQAKILRRNGKRSLLIEYLTLLSEDGSKPLREKVKSGFVRPLPPPDNDDQVFEVNDVVDAFCLDGWWVGVVGKVLNLGSDTKNYAVVFDDPPDAWEVKRSDLRTHWDWLDGKWVRPPKKQVLTGLVSADNLYEVMIFENSCGVEENAVEMATCSKCVQMQESTWSAENLALNAVTSTGKDMEQASSAVDTTLISHPLKKLKEGSADTALSLKACQLQSVPCELALSSHPPSSLTQTKDSKQQEKQQIEVATFSRKKRKRGYPPKYLVNGKEWARAGGAVDEMVVKDREIIDVEVLGNAGKSTGSGNISTETDAELSDAGCSTRQAEMSIVKKHSTGFINRDTVNQKNEANESLVEFSKQCAVKGSTSNITSKGNLSLPFTKHSSILKVIESMEVFQKMPQKPHFHLLDKNKEMYLEGLAIGYTITFANVVEQTSKLHVNDSRSVFNSISEALLDLESHGFDVKTVHSRLTELQSIKERQECFQEQLKNFETQILEQTDEQTKIMEEFDAVVKEMKLLGERKGKLLSLKVKNESEIAELKSKIDIVNEEIQNAQLDFESVAVSPW